MNSIKNNHERLVEKYRDLSMATTPKKVRATFNDTVTMVQVFVLGL